MFEAGCSVLHPVWDPVLLSLEYLKILEQNKFYPQRQKMFENQLDGGRSASKLLVYQEE